MPAAPRKSIATTMAVEEERPTKVQKVHAAFSLIKDYPPAAKEMLLAGLPHAGGAAHPWQGEVFDMADEALAKGRSQVEEKNTMCTQAVTAVEEKITAQDETCKAVSEEISAASTKCKECEEELNAMQAKITWAQKELASAKKESHRAGPALAKLEKEEEEIKVWQEKEIGGSALNEEDIETFQAYLQKQKVEPALVASVYNAILKNPDERGVFDGVTVKATLEYLAEKRAALESRHSECKAACEDADALLLGAQAMLDVADEKEATGLVAHAEAKDIHDGLEAKLKEEQKRAAAMGKELEKAKHACTSAEGEVQLFDNAIAELWKLRHGDEDQSESKAPLEAPEGGPLQDQLCA